MPVEDITPPSRDQVYTFAETLCTALAADKTVVTHCLAGIGRTTTMLSPPIWCMAIPSRNSWPVSAYATRTLPFAAARWLFCKNWPRTSVVVVRLSWPQGGTAMPVTLTVHDSQYPDRVAEQLRRGLRTRKLPGKFLYDPGPGTALVDVSSGVLAFPH